MDPIAATPSAPPPAAKPAGGSDGARFRKVLDDASAALCHPGPTPAADGDRAGTGDALGLAALVVLPPAAAAPDGKAAAPAPSAGAGGGPGPKAAQGMASALPAAADGAPPASGGAGPATGSTAPAEADKTATSAATKPTTPTPAGNDQPAPPPGPPSLPPAVAAPTGAAQATATPAPAPASPAPPRTPVPAEPAALAIRMARHLESGEQRFQMRLDPAELGRVDVDLSVDENGRVKAHLSVERPEALQILQRDGRELIRALTDQGLRLDGSSISFSLRDGRGDGQDQHRDGWRPGRGGLAAAAQAPGAIAAAAAPATRPGTATLDIHV